MSWRRLPPVHSPIDTGALLAGVLAAPDARRRLEAELAAGYAADEVVLTDSGTSALQLAIDTATPPSDRIVALPAYACYDLATAAVGADVRVALYDVDPHTLGPEPVSLARAIDAGAGAVVIAVPFGLAPDWPVLETLTAARSVHLIEDAAQGHGSSFAGGPLGSLAPWSVLSFGRGKGWTGGSGGALLLRGAASIGTPRIRRAVPGSSLGSMLRATVQAVAGHPSLYRVPSVIPWLGLGETRYRQPGRPRRMAAAAAAILRASRRDARREAEHRDRTGAFWAERLYGMPGLSLILPVESARPGYLRYPVRVAGDRRASLLERFADLGVATTYPTTLAALPAIRERRVDREEFPGSELLVRELVTLPTHRHLRSQDIDRIVRHLVPFSTPVQRPAPAANGPAA